MVALCLVQLLAPCLALPVTAEPLALPAVVPPRQVELQGAKVPAWKATWDQARQAVRAGDYAAAVSLYETLFTQRQGIDEARWELAKIYLQLRQWQKAVALLEVLADAAPGRLDYLDALGVAMSEQAHWGRAIELFSKVRGKDPADLVAIKGMVRGLLALGREEEALPQLEDAYRREPENLELRLELARLAYKLGHYELARPHLVALAAVPSGGAAILRMTARVHEKLGLENLAVDYWQRLVTQLSDDDEAHRQLAAFFEKGGHAREALPHLLALKRLNPGDSSLLLRIGKGWAASESPQEALPYLNQYVQEQPDDIEALELLVNIYANLGKKADVLANLERFFAVKAEPDAMKLKQAARLYDAAGRFGDAVTAYRRYLAVVSSAPEAVSAMAAALRKLAVHGRYEELVGFGEQEPPVAVDPDAYRLMMAAAFAAGGQEQRAVVEYRRVIAAGGGHARMARLAMADLYREMGLSFAAEQVLRQALTPAGGPGEAEVLYRLFSLSLAEGELDAAGGWLRRLTTVAGGTSAAWQARLAEVELLAGNGEYRAADRGGRRLLAELAERKGTGEARARVAMALARFAIADGALPVALRQLESRFRGGGTLPLEVVVLQQHLYGELGEIAKADGVFLRALSEADRADDGLLRLAELYRREGMAQAMLKVATLAHQRLPDSLRAAVLRAEAWLLVGETDKGLAALRQLVDAFPLESRAAALLVRFCFARGRYGEALAAAEKVLARDGDRPDILLLKARCLWVLQRGPEALKIYQSYLTPAVAGQLGDEIKAEGLSCPPLVTKPTFWQIVSLRGESEAGFIDTLMSAAHAAAAETDSSRGRLQVLADAHYARYRWQKRFAFEFAARRAEQNKEYLYAARQYQALLRREPENGALLFDLARIYSRLGWSGEEAALYDQLAEQQADFPGLGEVRQRNRLKRRPRTTLSYGYENEEGRDGYKAIRRDWQEASLWLSPWSRHELDLSVSRRRYRSTDGDGKARSSRAMLSYAAGLTSWLSARVGGGFELPDKNELSETTLFQGELTGKIGDKVNARLTYERDPVTDTYGSFVRNVVRETVRGGGSLDLLPRLQAGGDYAYTDFSDGNRTKGYDFWGAYVLFTEPNFLQFCYRYDFLDSQEGPQGTKLPGADDFAVEDHPYWAPQNYWSNRFSVLFRHQFAGETLDHSRPSYYTAEYSVAYDARGRQLQTVGGTLCLELTQHFLATAGASLTSSDVYRAKDVSLSIAYRW